MFAVSVRNCMSCKLTSDPGATGCTNKCSKLEMEIGATSLTYAIGNGSEAILVKTAGPPLRI
jgi:hypothetical protein